MTKEELFNSKEARDISFSVAYKGLAEKKVLSAIKSAAEHGKMNIRYERGAYDNKESLSYSEKRLLEFFGYVVTEEKCQHDGYPSTVVTTISW